MVDINKNIENHWEEAHRKKDQYWLTGSNPNQVYMSHGIKAQIDETRGLSILEIGIGLGDSIKYLSKSHSVTAMDISETAIKSVSAYSEGVIVSDFEKLEKKFDLIICHLVLQHCDTDMVKYLITNSIRCLNANGVFSFQFAYLPPESILDEFMISSMKNGTHYFKSLEEIKDIINSNNGKVISVSKPIVYRSEYNIHWYFVKCGRHIK